MASEKPDKVIALVIEDDLRRRTLASSLVAGGAVVMEFDLPQYIKPEALERVSAIITDAPVEAFHALLEEAVKAGYGQPEIHSSFVPSSSGVAPATAAAVLAEIRGLEARVQSLVQPEGGHGAFTPVPSDGGETPVSFKTQAHAKGEEAPEVLETPMLDSGGANYRVVAFGLFILLGAVAYLLLAPEPPLTEEELAQQAYEWRQDADTKALASAAAVVESARGVARRMPRELPPATCAELVVRQDWALALERCQNLNRELPADAVIIADAMLKAGQRAQAMELLFPRVIESPNDADVWYALGKWADGVKDPKVTAMVWSKFLALEGEGERAEFARAQLQTANDAVQTDED